MAKERTDEERLDWMERHRPFVTQVVRGDDLETLCLRWAWNSVEGLTFRDAIDEALDATDAKED